MILCYLRFGILLAKSLPNLLDWQREIHVFCLEENVPLLRTDFSTASSQILSVFISTFFHLFFEERHILVGDLVFF